MPGAAASKRLVIVESPAKAKTIGKYLGPGYDVRASVGHIRDLPQNAAEVPAAYKGQSWASEGVDVDNGFAPLYVVAPDKKARITELKRALAEAEELLLATDEDREGEAIAWHLQEVLKPKVPTRRMVFHEITQEAIQAALEDTRDIDTDLVDAQETRRIVDRLVGYRVSPVLWRRMGWRRTSAGRVQSVALRLVVQRERERLAFRAAEYCDVEGTFSPEEFPGASVEIDGRRIAGGGDFDDRGALKDAGLLVLDLAQAEALAADLRSAAFTVDSVKEKPRTVRPRAPFTTSTLQQAAGGRLRWGADRTMRVAQGLYERGYITYMRTDSTQLSQQAIAAARDQAGTLYGPEFVAEQVRTYANKTRNAQEAHEAIRPAGEQFRTPAEVSGELRGDEYMLYELIWKRTVASQMADGRDSTTTVRFSATEGQGRVVTFRASGTVVVFPGFRAAYADPPKESPADGAAVGPARLPRLAVGDSVAPLSLEPKAHRTSPPARYTEATLIKKLEELGVGRPSTYASTMATIQNREYVWKKGSALVPSYLGMAVTQVLERHFGELVDYEFTRRVEDVLDAIARGDEHRLAALTRFYSGTDDAPGLAALVDGLGDIDVRGIAAIPIADSDIVARVGRYGVFLERESDGKRATIRTDIPPDELDAATATELVERGSEHLDLGTHPETGLAVLAKQGRYGPYVEEQLPEGSPAKARPRTASLLQSMSMESLTLEDAVRLLSLPRVVGVDPETGEEITAQNGRYGPYLKRGTDSRSLAEEEQLFTISLEQAQEIYRQPKRGRGATAAPGRALGEHPQTGLPVEVKKGRFGPYITDGEYNVTLKDDDPDTVTLERAADLLAARREAGPPPKKRGAKKTAKKAAKKSTKKTAAKKTSKKAAAKKTTKRTAAKKATAKKATAKASSAAAAEGSAAPSAPAMASGGSADDEQPPW